MSKHLLIDAVGARSGGGLTVALDIVSAAIKHDGFHRITITCLPEIVRHLPHNTTKLHIVHIEASSDPRRLQWHTSLLQDAAKHLLPHVILDLNALGHSPKTPRAVLLQQLLIYSPQPPSTPLKLAFRMGLLRTLTRRAAQSSQLAFTQTPHVAQLAREQLRLHPDLLRVHTPCASWPPDLASIPQELLNAPQDRRLLYVGSDLPTKRLDLILNAHTVLRRIFPDLALFLTLHPLHPALVSRPGVFGLGHLPRHILRATLCAATCLISASDAETACLPIIEAMSVGCPVVATDLPHTQHIAQDAALTFPAGQEPQLIAQIKRLIESHKLREDYGSRGLKRHQQLLQQRPYQAMLDDLLSIAKP